MADLELSQAEADALIAMEKLPVDDKPLKFPDPGGRLAIPLVSTDKREYFVLDVQRNRIKVAKATFQERTRQVVTLMRLDIAGAPHRNPDGIEIPCPHLHIYREGYGDKWAVPAPRDRYPDVANLFAALESFLRHCNIASPKQLNPGLF